MGYVLMVSILILGGIIATLGDRIGTKVGKARLSLFKLRPKRTAVVITIFTGVIISGTTLGILVATSKPLRVGLFDIDEIQADLRRTKQSLDRLKQQKAQAEAELAKANSARDEAGKRLAEINKFLQQAIEQKTRTTTILNQTQNQLKLVSEQAKSLQQDINKIESEREKLIKQREQVKNQIAQLKLKVNQRDQEIAQQEQAITQQKKSLEQQDQTLKKLDQQIATRDEVIATRENLLKQLEKQQTFLKGEVKNLEKFSQSYRQLRQGNLALMRGQVLSMGVLRIVDPTAATQAMDRMLRQANDLAIQSTQPTVDTEITKQIIQIPQAQVDQVIEKLKSGQEYVIQVMSAGNYLVGENKVQIVVDIVPNELVFKKGEIVTSIQIEPEMLNSDELIRNRLDVLLVASQFRAKNAGIISEELQISDGKIGSLVNFIDQLKKIDDPVIIKAIVAQESYTAGPLKLDLVAIKDGTTIFSTSLAQLPKDQS